MSRYAAIVFVAVCLIGLYQTANANVIPQPEMGSPDGIPVIKGERGIDLQCTVKCTEFWLCKAKCLFMCNCDAPPGCDCNNWG